MRVIGRLLLALAIALPISWVVAVGVAAGDGPLVVKCMHWEDGMRLTPGVGNNPSSQSVAAHGKLWSCNKAGGGAIFNATLSMSNATCSNLAMSGSAQFDWVNGAHSSAFLTFQPQLETRKVVERAKGILQQRYGLSRIYGRKAGYGSARLDRAAHGCWSRTPIS